MNRNGWLVISLLISLSILLTLSTGIKANGQLVGLVCLSPQTVAGCPAPPVSITGNVGSQLFVSVLVQGSDPFGGFDITLNANHTILKPANVLTSGSLLAGGTTILTCIGGVLKSGSVCSQTDNVDTIHFVYVGPAGFLTTLPSTGLLFTAVFNITSSTSTSIGYQTGCSQTSVLGTTTCVLLSTGSPVSDQETVQSATYTIAPTPTFILIPDSSIEGVRKASSVNYTIFASSLYSFAGSISLSATITPARNHNPTSSFNPGTMILPANGLVSSILTVSTRNNTSQGFYTITVTGTSGMQTSSIQVQLQVVT